MQCKMEFFSSLESTELQGHFLVLNRVKFVCLIEHMNPREKKRNEWCARSIWQKKEHLESFGPESTQPEFHTSGSTLCR